MGARREYCAFCVGDLVTVIPNVHLQQLWINHPITDAQAYNRRNAKISSVSLRSGSVKRRGILK